MDNVSCRHVTWNCLLSCGIVFIRCMLLLLNKWILSAIKISLWKNKNYGHFKVRIIHKNWLKFKDKNIITNFKCHRKNYVMNIRQRDLIWIDIKLIICIPIDFDGDFYHINHYIRFNIVFLWPVLINQFWQIIILKPNKNYFMKQSEINL
jgi:hypothetical protein